MKFKRELVSGDPVRIRLPDGRIVEGQYDGQLCRNSKQHFVEAIGDVFIASSEKPREFDIDQDEGCHRVRFVYPVEQMK